MAEVLDLPVSGVRKLAAIWRDEERAFQTVLEVLKESRRFDLALKLHSFQAVRRRRVFRLVMEHLSAAREPKGM